MRSRIAGPNPLSLYVLGDTLGSAAIIPRAAILSRASSPNRPVINWNFFKDGTVSKAMQISTNPFLLRRFARRVANLWEQQYGAYPGVFADTGLSLNGRPPQSTVDPNADLASVSITAFGHNAWINDLALPRIPPRSTAEGH